MINKIAAALFILVASLVPAAAQQSGCQYITTGAVLTAAQWNYCFQQKQDALVFTPVNKAGDSMLGRLSTFGSTASRAGFAVQPGTAPLAPLDGDIWVTTAGIFVRINGTTVGPLYGPGSGPTTLTNSLGADVLMNNTANFFAGPTVAQGTSGKWSASGTVTLTDTAGAANFSCRLWDGTTVIASGRGSISAANGFAAISLSGTILSPAGSISIGCKDTSSTSGKILFNTTGLSKDSTVTVTQLQ